MGRAQRGRGMIPPRRGEQRPDSSLLKEPEPETARVEEAAPRPAHGRNKSIDQEAIVALGLESLMQVKINHEERMRSDFGALGLGENSHLFHLSKRLAEIHEIQNDLLSDQLLLDSKLTPGLDYEDDQFEAFKERVVSIDALAAQLGE